MEKKKFDVVGTLATALATVGGSVVSLKLMNNTYNAANTKVEGPIELIGYLCLAAAGGIAAGRAANGAVKAIDAVVNKSMGDESDTEETDDEKTTETETVSSKEVEA